MDVFGLLVNTVVVGLVSNGWSPLFGESKFSTAMLETFFGGAAERLVGASAPLKDAVRAAQRSVNGELDRRGFDTPSREAVGRAVSELLQPFLLAADAAVAAGYDPAALAAKVVADHPRAVQGLTPDQRDACRDVLAAALAAGLSNRDHLNTAEAEFRRAVLKGFGDLPADLHAFGRRLQAAALLAPQTRKPYQGRAFESAAVLLDARFGDLELLGRDALLEDFDRWRTGAGVGVRLVVGPGGIGKTRLGIELCRRAERDGWRAGFLDSAAREAPADVWPLLLDDPRPLLIVVDYAETRVLDLERLFQALAPAHRPGGPRARVVLIARAAGDWWDGRGTWGGDGVARFADGPAVQGGPIDLKAQPDLPAAAIFRAAADSFVAALGGGAAPEVPAPDLSAEVFGLPLFVRIAALHHVEAALAGGGLPAPGAMDTEDKLLDETLKRERKLSREHGGFVEDDELKEVVDAAAFATLTGGCGEPDAVCFLARVPSLAEMSGERRKKAARWLARFYPGPRFLNPVTPDRLGERLVALRLRAHGDPADGANPLLSAAIGDGAVEAERTQAFTVLNRLAARVPAEVRWLDRAFADHLAGCAKPALTVAVQTPEPIGPALERAFMAQEEPEAAVEIVAGLPERTVALAGLALVVTEQVARIASADEQATEERKSLRAAVLNNLSNRLSDLGRREAALAAVEEAAALYRELAAARPDAFRPALAMALNNLSNCFSALGRREAALAAVEEGTALCRKLAAARPDAFGPDLASALNTLSSCFSALGRREAALAAVEEAAALYRELAAARPDAFRPDLAMALNNLSSCFSALGRREAALAAVEEAVAIRRELAAARPDAFRPALASALNTLSNRLSDLGRREAALAAAEEAAALYRELAAARPDAFRLNYCRVLWTRGNALKNAGRLAEAIASYREGIATLTPLFVRHPAACGGVMAGLRQGYLQTCEEAGEAVDEEMLRPVAEVFAALQAQQDGDAPAP